MKRVCKCGESDQSQFGTRNVRQKDGSFKLWKERRCNACILVENRERSIKGNSYLNLQLTEDEKLFNKVLQKDFGKVYELLNNGNQI